MAPPNGHQEFRATTREGVLSEASSFQKERTSSRGKRRCSCWQAIGPSCCAMNRTPPLLPLSSGATPSPCRTMEGWAASSRVQARRCIPSARCFQGCNRGTPIGMQTPRFLSPSAFKKATSPQGLTSSLQAKWRSHHRLSSCGHRALRSPSFLPSPGVCRDPSRLSIRSQGRQSDQDTQGGGVDGDAWSHR